jgi:hypothetical protein
MDKEHDNKGLVHPAPSFALCEIMNLGIPHCAVMIVVGLLTAGTDCHHQQQKKYLLDCLHFFSSFYNSFTIGKAE